MTTRTETDRIAMWDGSTRLFHWALTALFGVMWWTGEGGMLNWHRIAGYSIIALLMFRIIWGFGGSSTARFRNFMRSPRAVADYIRHEMFRREGKPQFGHNPLGGWSVIVLLSLLMIQCLLGLFSVDVDGLESGPFSYLVEFDTGRVAAELHETVFNALLAVVVLHIVAIFFYLAWRQQNLIRPMISGQSSWTGELPIMVRQRIWLGAAVFAGCGLAVYAAVALFGQV